MPIWNATGGEEAKQVFDELNCRSYFLTVPRGDVPKNCSDALNSISYYAFDGGLNKPCECDPTGSESTLCDKYTGECPCKKNVVGRRCDRCAPGTYGFSSEGCKRERKYNLSISKILLKYGALQHVIATTRGLSTPSAVRLTDSAGAPRTRSAVAATSVRRDSGTFRTASPASATDTLPPAMQR